MAGVMTGVWVTVSGDGVCKAAESGNKPLGKAAWEWAGADRPEEWVCATLQKEGQVLKAREYSSEIRSSSECLGQWVSPHRRCRQ